MSDQIPIKTDQDYLKDWVVRSDDPIFIDDDKLNKRIYLASIEHCIPVQQLVKNAVEKELAELVRRKIESELGVFEENTK